MEKKAKEKIRKYMNKRYKESDDHREYMKKYMNKKYESDEKFRERSHKNTNKYRNTKKGKAYVSEYNKRPEVRERVRLWRKKNWEKLRAKHYEYIYRPGIADRLIKQKLERDRKKIKN